MGRFFRRGWRRYSPALLLPVFLWVAEPEEVQWATEEATAQLVEILKLWNSENYGAIYDRGTTTTKRLFSRAEFISRMRGLGCKTKCCHTTFELHSADYRSPRLVIVTGKVGLELTGRVAPRFECAPAVRSYPMTWEVDGWRLDLTLILPFF